jgi:hypothetical protein
MTEPSPPEVRPAVRQPWLDPLVRLADDQFRIPGTNVRFGLDALLGALFPVAGDSVTTALAAWIVVVAWRDGAPPALLARMVTNVAVDVLVGSVPVLGDWFDVVYRANRKNHTLLRDFQARRYSESHTSVSARDASRVAVVKWVLPILLVVLGLLLLIPLAVAVLIGYWIAQ